MPRRKIKKRPVIRLLPEFKNPDTICHRPIWDLCKEFINGLKIGEKFTRSTLLHSVYARIPMGEIAVDKYRRSLTILGILEHNERGVYIKKHNIPKHVTVTQLTKAAYDDSWKTWFIPLEDRFKKE